jgi:hypothetical protein
MAHDFGNQGTVLSGVEASTTKGAGILPELPRSNFYLMHHPEGWEPVEDSEGNWEWLPTLKRLLLKPGVNGVRGGGGQIDDSFARVGFADRGWTILDRQLGYVTRYPCRRGYSYYLTWDTPSKVGRRLIVRHDSEGYNEFRRELVTSGTVPAPVAEILEGILETYSNQINRNSKDIHIPTVKAKIEATQELIDGASAAAAVLTGKPKAKPRRRRSKPEVTA